MKLFSKVVALGAVLAASSSFAFADSIQLGGGLSFNLGTGAVTFDNSKSTVVYSGTGILSDFTVGSTVTFYNFTYNPTPNPSQELVSIKATDGATLQFNMTSELFTTTGTSPTTGLTSYDLSGMGVYSLTTATGTTTPLGAFDLTTQGQGSNTSNLSFSNVEVTASSVTPEPNSLVLLGTGLIGAAGMIFMRRRQTANLF